jgi:hypothetical protein
MNRTFTTDLALTCIKATILTIIVLGVMASMSSCTRVAGDNPRRPIKWRARALKSNRIVFVTNPDTLGVLAGDTVLVNYNEQNYTYYIANCGYAVPDTSYLDQLADSSFYHYEAINVVLETPYH